MTLKKGDKGQAVMDLQTALNNAGYGPLYSDGVFGSSTERAVRELQAACKLVVDGIAGKRTQAAMGVEIKEKNKPTLNWSIAVRSAWEQYKDLIADECSEMGIEVATALSIIAVESAGKGLAANGLPTIRFENHLVMKYLDPEVYSAHFKHDRSKRWLGHEVRTGTGSWSPVHTKKQESEYSALTVAMAYDSEGAYKSISMGAGQLLGSWHTRLGYDKAEDMFNAFTDEEEQIKALFRFIRTGSNNHYNPDGDMWAAAKEKRWYDFARQYNGPGQPEIYKDYLEGAYASALTIIE